MCGRFQLSISAGGFEEAFGIAPPDGFAERFNVAPSHDAPVVRIDDDARASAMLRWGLVPSWSKHARLGSRMINARVETLLEKPTYKAAFKQRRCLVPTNGFYEWQAIPGQRHKQPVRIAYQDDRPFAFAGLWEHWEGDGEVLETFTILTTMPNELVDPIHDRMPVILPADAHERWLDHSITDPQGIVDLLGPIDPTGMVAIPVSTYVNDPRHEGPECAEPVEAESSLFERP